MCLIKVQSKCRQFPLKILISFLPHKDIHKYICTKIRAIRPMKSKTGRNNERNKRGDLTTNHIIINQVSTKKDTDVLYRGIESLYNIVINRKNSENNFVNCTCGQTQ